MATVNTNDLRIRNAKNLVRFLTGFCDENSQLSFLNLSIPKNDTYLFVGMPREWSGFGVNDTNPPLPKNNSEDFYQIYHEIIDLVKINYNDVYHAIRKIKWVSGATFDMYRHDYSTDLLSSSGASDLYDSSFVVLNQDNDVYVCLYNGSTPENPTGVISTVEPRGNSLSPFYTSDGYQWLYLFGDNDLVNLFDEYLPLNKDRKVNIQEEGAVFTAVINNRGSGYTSSPEGVSNTLPYYYCRILGDGSDAVAKVFVENGFIQNIQIVRHGTGYTYGHIDFRPNHVYQSLFDLDQGLNGLDPLGDNLFSSTVIISPPGGWGSDIVRQLGGTNVVIRSRINYNERNIQSGFRQIGILDDVSVESEELYNKNYLSSCYSVMVENMSTRNYIIGERITQKVKIGDFVHNAYGYVIGWNKKTNILRYVQNPKYDSDIDGNLYHFSGNLEIVGLESNKSTIPKVDFDGIDDETGLNFVEGYSYPEVKKHSGNLIYVTNLRPVESSSTQEEDVSLLICY